MIVKILSEIISFAIMCRMIFSWIPHVKLPLFITATVKNITEPFYDIARKLPTKYGAFDFSGIVALLIVFFATNIIIAFLIGNFV